MAVINDSPAKGSRLFVATPSYSGQVCCQFVVSYVATWGDCLLHGIACELRFAPGYTLVQQGRNVLVAQFLASDATHLMFIDDDMGWTPTAPRKLLEHGVPMIAGVYPRKTLKRNWTCWVADSMKPDERGLIEAITLPGGFLLMTRDCVKRLAEGMPTYTFIGAFEESVTVPAFFDTRVEDGLLWGEDTIVSRRWRELGGTCWIDPDIDFSHIGRHDFGGNYAHRGLL